MARAALSTDPLADLSEPRLERLARAAGHLLGGRPIHLGGALPHPRPIDAGLEFMEHRPLLTGDDPRHVDWRASARRQQPLVRRYRDERAGEWILCLDGSASMGECAPGAWALALQLAAALAYVLIALEHRVGLALFSDGLDRLHPPGRGRRTYLALRRLLAGCHPRTDGGNSRLEACLPLLERGRHCAVIGDFLAADAMRVALGRLRVRCDSLHVFQVIAPVPALAEGEGLRLRDAESGALLAAWADGLLAERVATRHAELARGLARYCDEGRIRHSPCPVGTPWDRILLRHLVGPEACLA
jgi:uncharacterized protein (DUF58 family)